MAAVEIADYLEKGAVKNSVNLPNTNLPESFESRTCFIHNEDEAFGTKVTAAAAAQAQRSRISSPQAKRDSATRSSTPTSPST